MADDYTSWEPQPSTRGTWSILSSCLITLVLCVYTAVHLNVPAASETRAQRFQYITGWVLLGVFAPEVVAWVAWCQWREAKDFTKYMQKMQRDLLDTERCSGQDGRDMSSIAPLINSWTHKHSYFVLMGGFQFRSADAVQLSGPDKKYYDKILPYHYLPRRVVSTAGFKALLQDGHGPKIPVLSEGDINDRSKADNLAKTLSSLQGCWLLIQIIGRLASRLSITELEINTLAHVLCALAMYVFWWRKPLRVEQPVFLESMKMMQWVFAHGGLEQGHQRWLHSILSMHQDPTCDDELYSIHVHENPRDYRTCNKCQPPGVFGLFLRRDVSVSAEEVVKELKSMFGNYISGFVVFLGDNELDFSEFERESRKTHPYHLWPILSVNQSELDFLLGLHIRSPEIWQTWQPEPEDCENGGFYGQLELTKCSRMIKPGYTDDARSIAVTLLLSALYGAIHASLWQHHFPTKAEMLMWQISCLVVAGSGLLLAQVFFRINAPAIDRTKSQRIRTCVENVVAKVWRDTMGRCHISGSMCLVVAFMVVACAIVFCRCFLFIEAFISLRSQPRSAYQTPDWSQWLPHL